MSLRLVHGLSAPRTYCVALAMAALMAAFGYAGQPRMDDVRAAAPLFVEPARVVKRPTGDPGTGPRYDVAIAQWATKARAEIIRYIGVHGGHATHTLIAALTSPVERPRLAPAGFTYGPALGELELGTAFVGRSIRTALRPAPLPVMSDVAHEVLLLPGKAPGHP